MPNKRVPVYAVRMGKSRGVAYTIFAMPAVLPKATDYGYFVVRKMKASVLRQAGALGQQ